MLEMLALLTLDAETEDESVYGIELSSGDEEDPGDMLMLVLLSGPDPRELDWCTWTAMNLVEVIEILHLEVLEEDEEALFDAVVGTFVDYLDDELTPAVA